MVCNMCVCMCVHTYVYTYIYTFACSLTLCMTAYICSNGAKSHDPTPPHPPPAIPLSLTRSRTIPDSHTYTLKHSDHIRTIPESHTHAMRYRDTVIASALRHWHTHTYTYTYTRAWRAHTYTYTYSHRYHSLQHIDRGKPYFGQRNRVTGHRGSTGEGE